jgi:hypothetical protein
MKFAHALSLGLLIGGSPIASLRAQSQPDYELPPIEYSTRTPRDAFASLRSELESGAWTLPGDERQMLQALLDRLAVPTSSQVLVFSRTSLQRGRIRPERPRALYFSDSVYVGWVPGGLFEVAAIDPVLGPSSIRSTPDPPAEDDRASTGIPTACAVTVAHLCATSPGCSRVPCSRMPPVNPCCAMARSWSMTPRPSPNAGAGGM